MGHVGTGGLSAAGGAGAAGGVATTTSGAATTTSGAAGSASSGAAAAASSSAVGTGGGGPGGGVGCIGTCLFDSSFTTAEGWTSDTQQFGSGCGSGFSGIQQGIGNNGAWHTGDGSCDAVAIAANYSGGAGGRGFRHYRGDGTNNNGGGMSIDLPSQVTEIWYSLWIRFSSGFEWVNGKPNYTKDLYWHTGNGYLVAGHQGGGWGFDVGGHDNYGGSADWMTLYAGGTADGSWHCLDYYHDIASSTARVWVDGVNTLDSSSINYSGFGSFGYFQLGENQALVSGGDYYTDYDDVRIDTGLPVGSRLGCPGGGG